MKDTAREPKLVFVSWAPDITRSTALAEKFNAKIFHLHALGFKRVWLAPFKYVILAIRTLRLLEQERPDIIFVLNPPYFSGLVVWIYTLFREARYILDSHSGAFIEKKWVWLEPLHRFIVRRALVSIVTNEHLAKRVEQWGGRYFIIGDVPTDFSARSIELPHPHVAVINTFSIDEPVEEVLEAARQLPDVQFSVTGDLSYCPAALCKKAPANLRFTGYIPMQDYVNMLYSSDLALVLTTHNYTMQRGIYESVSLGVPVVASDWPILTTTFAGGGEFCDNTADGIARAVTTVLAMNSTFKSQVQALKTRRLAHWRVIQAEFRTRFLWAKPNDAN